MDPIMTEGIYALFNKFPSITTFSEVSDWDEAAKREIERLQLANNSIDLDLSQKQQALAQTIQAKKEKSAFARVFSGSGEERKLNQAIQELVYLKEEYQELIVELQGKVEVSPNNPEEQSKLLKDLYLKKKELQVKKRELNASMRDIRTEARQKSANVPNTFLGAVGGSKYRASTRQSIRVQKEAVLAPFEVEKSTIEREVLQVEKAILWVEKLR